MGHENTGLPQNSQVPSQGAQKEQVGTEDKVFFQTLTQALSNMNQRINDQTFARPPGQRKSNSLHVRLPDLPLFDASLPELIVYFFEQFELIKQIQEWDDKECIDHLRLKHTGTAKTILEEELLKITSMTYENVKKQLMDRYLSPAVMQSIMDQLLQVKQAADESLNQYYNRFKYLHQVVASRTTDWYIGRFEVNCFVKGFLNKTLSDNVCRRYPKTLDEAYQFALEENRLFYMQSNSQLPPPQPPPKPDNPPPQQNNSSQNFQNPGQQSANTSNNSQQSNNKFKNNNRGWQNNRSNNNNQKQNQGQNRQNRPKCSTCGFANHQSNDCWYNPNGPQFKGIPFNYERHSYEAFLKRRANNQGQNSGQKSNPNNNNQTQNQGGKGQGGRAPYKNTNANAITNTAGRQTTINFSNKTQSCPNTPTSTSPPPWSIDKQFMDNFVSQFWQGLYNSNPANSVPVDQQGNAVAPTSNLLGSLAGGIGQIHM